VEPIYQPSLPSGYFNTVTVARHVGFNAVVCGKLVRSSYSKSGKLWPNLDKSYPNNTFSIFIRKEDLTNFDSDITTYYENQKYVYKVKSKVSLIVLPSLLKIVVALWSTVQRIDRRISIVRHSN